MPQCQIFYEEIHCTLHSVKYVFGPLNVHFEVSFIKVCYVSIHLTILTTICSCKQPLIKYVYTVYNDNLNVIYISIMQNPITYACIFLVKITHILKRVLFYIY
jgi:hypothetical protein